MIRSIICVFFAAIFLGGCTTKFESPAVTVLPSAPADKRVVISPALRNVVQVVQISDGRQSSGYYGVHVTLQNITRERKRVAYRLHWYDEKGEPISLPEVPAQPWTMFPGEVSPLIIAPQSPQVRNFSIEIYVPRD